MTLPVNLQTITVTGTYLDTTGVPLSGSLTFTPPAQLVDVATAIMYAAPVTATLDSSGHFSVTLICTDNSTLSPAGWSYTVVETIMGTRSYTIYVPHTLGSSIDLSVLVPLPALGGGTVPQTVAAIAPGYAGLAYNNTWTGIQTFQGAVSFASAPSIPGGAIAPLDWVNIMTTGGKGDGSTDDVAALVAAAAALGPNGGTVYLPATTNGYLFNSTGANITKPGVLIRGAGAENTKILIGPAFSDTAAIKLTGYNDQVLDLSISGASSTTTSNPVANAVEITGVRRNKVSRCTFFNINGWAIEAVSSNASSTSNVLGTQLTQLYASSCAGGIHILGNTTQGYAVNSELSDIHIASGGVATGASANLDGIRIEDAWDVLGTNIMAWTTTGTGSSFHVKGNSAATFITNLDALGPAGGPCVLVEDGPNGSPQNTQISGGVIQQGSPGLQISGGSKQVHINTSRIINNYTHGVTVSGTSSSIYLNELFFSLNGAGASGSNYEVNWSGTATGYVSGCKFATPVTSIGVAGVQNVANIASAGQAVRFINDSFQGTGATSANWFTNVPSAVVDLSGGNVNFATTATFSASTAAQMKGNVALQPSASGNTVVSGNVGGTDAFDRLRVLGSGTIQLGPGTANRDVQLARTGTGLWVCTNPVTAHGAIYGVDGNIIVGGTTSLGDGGVGELQFTNATTVPTGSPTGGASMFANGGNMYYVNSSGFVVDLSENAATGNTAVITGTTTLTTLAAGSTLAANTLQQGQVYKFKAWGVLSTTATAQTFTIALYFGGTGGTLLLSFGAQQPNSGATVTNGAWVADFDVVAVSATSLAITGWDGVDFFFNSQNDGVVTVSNTTSKQLVIGVTPSASGASITCTGYSCLRLH